MPAAVRVTGPLDVAALRASLNEIVRRHEALRTTFATVGGRPVQRIAEQLPVPLEVVDLSAAAEAEREAEVRHRAIAEAQRPFDLSTGPLLRVCLLRASASEHVFLLTMHHIVSDGWSMGVFIRELAALYQAFSAGQPSPLEALAVQYADYAVWQRQWLSGAVLEEQLAYCSDSWAMLWRHSRSRRTGRVWRCAASGGGLSVGAVGRVDGVVTCFEPSPGHHAVHDAVGSIPDAVEPLLGQEQVCVGTPIAGRSRPEIEGLIGFFVNTLVLRGDLSDDPSFAEFLGRVRETALGAYAHQDLPFEQLVGHLQPERI